MTLLLHLPLMKKRPQLQMKPAFNDPVSEEENHRPPALTKTTSSQRTGCSRWNKDPPKDDHVLNPRSCECITLQGKRDIVDVIKDVEMGTLSWIMWWAQDNQSQGP